MNLMFWKRKTGGADDAENAPGSLAENSKPRESLDFSAAQPDLAARDPESSGAELPDPEAASLETPARPGLGVRVKLQFIALARRFRKTPAPDTEEEVDLADEADASPAPETPARPGLLLRIKAGFAAFGRELRAPAAPAAEADQEAGAPSRAEAAAEDELPEETPGTEAVRSRKWLVIGGSAVIVVLLAVDIAITLWLAYEPPQKRWGTRHDITSISSRPLDSESAPEGSQVSAPGKSQAEVEALRKENAALQARLEALKKAPQQQPYALPAVQAGEGSAPSSSAGGEMRVVNKDPRAVAMSLKEAIEAMNAGSGDHDKKPAK